MATQTPQRRRRFLRNWKFSMPKHPGLDYLMLRISIFVLVGIGVVMAFSATMTWSVIEGNTVWAQAIRLTFYLVLGWRFSGVHCARLLLRLRSSSHGFWPSQLF